MSRMKEINDIQDIMEEIILNNKKLLELSKKIKDNELSKYIHSYCTGIIILTQNINNYIVKRIPDMYESDKIDINFGDIIKRIVDDENTNIGKK